MAKDMKEYNRHYYAAHRDIWERNYAENADARRQRARNYANEKWKNDPEYKASHIMNTIERSRRSRRVKSLLALSEKIFKICQKISGKFL